MSRKLWIKSCRKLGLTYGIEKNNLCVKYCLDHDRYRNIDTQVTHKAAHQTPNIWWWFISVLENLSGT